MNIVTYLIPVAILGILILGTGKKINVMKCFAEGVSDGLRALFGVFPMLILMLMALAMFRGSGAVEILTSWIAPLCSTIGIPPEIIPLAILRPISGSGSIAQLSECLNVYGADSMTGRIASVLAASSETTFYTYALYSSAAGVNRLPYALSCGLFADLAAFIFSVLSVRLLFR